MKSFRFTKVQSSYAPQITWQVKGNQFFLHPVHHQSSCQMVIDQNLQPLIWQDVFRLFSFTSINDIVNWVGRANQKGFSFLIGNDFLQAAGFSVDHYVLDELLFLYHCQEVLDKKSYLTLVFLIDNKNLPLRVLVQFLKRFYSIPTKQFERIPPNFFLELATLFSFDYIKNNSVRETFKIIADLPLDKILLLLQKMKLLQEQTHFDSRNRLNQKYFQLVESFRYPLLHQFDQAIKKISNPLIKQQKNITLQFHPSYEKSEFVLHIRLKEKQEIAKISKFFNQTNQEILTKILLYLQEGKVD